MSMSQKNYALFYPKHPPVLCLKGRGKAGRMPGFPADKLFFGIIERCYFTRSSFCVSDDFPVLSRTKYIPLVSPPLFILF